MVKVKQFTFSLNSLKNDDESPDFLEIPDEESDEGIKKRWIPFSVESDFGLDQVWIWAYMIEV